MGDDTPDLDPTPRFGGREAFGSDDAPLIENSTQMLYRVAVGLDPRRPKV